MAQEQKEKRTEPRRHVDGYYSVEIQLADTPLRYQFRIWNISSRGMCILVKEGSDFLGNIAVGDRMEMRYYQDHPPHIPNVFATRIAHISKDPNGRFKDHYMVGLEIVNKTS